MSMMGKSAKMSSTSSRFCCLSVDFIPYMQQETLPAVLGVHIYHTLIIAAMLPLQADSPPTGYRHGLHLLSMAGHLPIIYRK
jgi:hypothetical protein